MTHALWLRRWLPVTVGLLVTVALWVFGFFPLRDRAALDLKRSEALELHLQRQLTQLQLTPERQRELDSLWAYLEDFQTGLFRTDQVDAAMRALVRRAAQANVELWSLDPSVPALISLADPGDTTVPMQLAVLPVTFECYGTYLSVGKFLESEERRAGFARWETLTITPAHHTGDVHARGQASLFLLPAIDHAGDAS